MEIFLKIVSEDSFCRSFFFFPNDLVSWNEVRPEVRGQRAASPMLE